MSTNDNVANCIYQWYIPENAEDESDCRKFKSYRNVPLAFVAEEICDFEYSRSWEYEMPKQITIRQLGDEQWRTYSVSVEGDLDFTATIVESK